MYKPVLEVSPGPDGDLAYISYYKCALVFTIRNAVELVAYPFPVFLREQAALPGVLGAVGAAAAGRKDGLAGRNCLLRREEIYVLH